MSRKHNTKHNSRGQSHYPTRKVKQGGDRDCSTAMADPTLSDAEAAARRDFTINAIAWDPLSGTIIDPHGGQGDLRAHLLRHTGPAFVAPENNAMVDEFFSRWLKPVPRPFETVTAVITESTARKN